MSNLDRVKPRIRIKLRINQRNSALSNRGPLISIARLEIRVSIVSNPCRIKTRIRIKLRTNQRNSTFSSQLPPISIARLELRASDE